VARRGNHAGPFWVVAEDEDDCEREQGVLQRCCVADAGSASGATMADFWQHWCRRYRARRWWLVRRWWCDGRSVLQRCCVAVAGSANGALMANFRQRWCRRCRARRWWLA